MTTYFLFDVFLAYSSKDKAIVRNIAERLRTDGIRVWFDEWEIHPGDHITAKTEEGLAHARILILCMSTNLFESDWSTMELHTFPFRDRLNKDRRFIPLQFDNTDIKGDLAQYKYINWLPEHREQSYTDLINACRLAIIPKVKPQEGAAEEPVCKSTVIPLGHSTNVTEFIVNTDGTMALSCSIGGTILLWELQTGKCMQVMEGHECCVDCVAWSTDGGHAISGDQDGIVRIWNLHTGKCLQVMEGHTDKIRSVAWSSDGNHVLSGSVDKTIRQWDIHTGKCIRVMEGHTYSINSLACSPDGLYVLSGSLDDTIRLWDMRSGECLRELKGHKNSVGSVAWSPDGKYAISGSDDKTVRFWNIHTGRCVRVIKEHKTGVSKVAWSLDNRYALSISLESARVWEVNTGKCLHMLKIKLHEEEAVNYVIWRPHTGNAKKFDSKTIQPWKFQNTYFQYSPEGESSSKVIWSPDTTYALVGCHSTIIQLWNARERRCIQVLECHSGPIDCIAWSPDGIHASFASNDGIIRIWNVFSGKCIKLLEGHEDSVLCVAWSPDGAYVLSGAYERTIRLWEVHTGKCLQVMDNHTDYVSEVVWSPDGAYALSGSYDQTIRLWDVHAGTLVRTMEGHSNELTSISWSPDGIYALSGSLDSTIRLWEVHTGKCLHIMEGHESCVTSVAWNKDGKHAVSGSYDRTIRLWEVHTGKCKRILTGHISLIENVQWCSKNNSIVSTDGNNVSRFWEIVLQEEDGLSQSTIPQQVTYCNTKVLLVGDSGVGKTGLWNYLALGIKDNGNNTSTDGAWATHWKLPYTFNNNGIDREIWLWDFAGQVDYRLVHQLFMDETSASVLVFNPQHENPFEGLGQWDHDLQKASRNKFARLLAAGRVDRGGLIVSKASVQSFMHERGIIFPLHFTSAKTGEGCIGLRDAILQAIDWEHIPKTTSPALYRNIKREIIQLRDSGMILIRLAELKQRIEMALPGEPFSWEELLAVIRLLDGPGIIQRLDFGDFILLRPEVLSRYAAAVVRKLRKHPGELGCIIEDELLNGSLDYQDFERLPAEEEKILLRALHEKLIARAWCLRQLCDGTALLIFPSYFRRERQEQSNQPNTQVTYRFSGPIEDIYATLVVRLHYTEAFESAQLWKDAADFTTQTGKRLGCKLVRETEGAARVEVYFDADVDENMRLVFARYIYNHLLNCCKNVERLRHYFCINKKCDDYTQPFTDRAKIDRALAPGGKGKVFCPSCGKPILLYDIMEEKFESLNIKHSAQSEAEKSKLNIDNESLERILLGHTIIITAQAGQIFRPTPNSDHGIDGEIEFKDDKGRATGKRLYLQLKSGDSYLVERKRDNAEVFKITNGRWADYWQQQAYPVLLVIRNSKGDIRWMDVSEYLKRNFGPDNKRPKQIIFSGEPFDAMSIRRWRDQLLRK